MWAKADTTCRNAPARALWVKASRTITPIRGRARAYRAVYCTVALSRCAYIHNLIVAQTSLHFDNHVTFARCETVAPMRGRKNVIIWSDMILAQRESCQTVEHLNSIYQQVIL